MLTLLLVFLMVRICLSGESLFNQGTFDFVYVGLQLFFERQTLFDDIAGIKHCGVRSRQACAYGGQWHLGVLLGEIHHHLACVGNFAFARLCEDQVGLDAVM